MIILKTRSEVKVKVTVTRKWYATLPHPKMYPHIKFGIPTSKSIGDMDRTRKRDGHTDGRTVRLLYASQSSFGGIKKIWLVFLQKTDVSPHPLFGVRKILMSLNAWQGHKWLTRFINRLISKVFLVLEQTGFCDTQVRQTDGCTG